IFDLLISYTSPPLTIPSTCGARGICILRLAPCGGFGLLWASGSSFSVFFPHSDAAGSGSPRLASNLDLPSTRLSLLFPVSLP
ncbi:hypothetical protein TPAR_00462, partial [Tolypocladium paradoxum]